jgi:CHAT domain-containing protein
MSSNNALCNTLFPGRIADVLKDYQTLFVSAVLNIGTVPWYSLQPFEDSSYLVDHFNIQIIEGLNHFSSYVLKNKNLLYMDSATFQSINPIIVGNPSFDDCNLEPLPGAEDEAAYVAAKLQTSTVPSDSVWLSTMTDKSSSGILSFKGDLIYMASHAVSSWDQPMDSSYIYLSDQNGSCNKLTARDILNIQKKSESLVILSACESGKGRSLNAGVIGLSRSFLINGINDGYPSDNFYGAQNVIMSLWNVNDASTKDFMKLFMDELSTPHEFFPISPLRTAILKYKEQEPDPLRWAAFQAMGICYPGGVQMKLE